MPKRNQILFIVTLVAILTVVFYLADREDRATVVDQTKESAKSSQPFLGNPDAKVVVDYYFDFYCPLCRQKSGALEQLAGEFGDQLKIEYHYLPLSDASTLALAAAECASRQDKFWPYYNLLFASQGQVFNSEQLKEFAGQLGLATVDFDRCLDSRETLAVVQSEMLAATRNGVNSVPTVLVSGKGVDFSNLEERVKVLVVGKK
jgi:protein-disulfide isomerase